MRKQFVSVMTQTEAEHIYSCTLHTRPGSVYTETNTNTSHNHHNTRTLAQHQYNTTVPRLYNANTLAQHRYSNVIPSHNQYSTTPIVHHYISGKEAKHHLTTYDQYRSIQSSPAIQHQHQHLHTTHNTHTSQYNTLV